MISVYGLIAAPVEVDANQFGALGIGLAMIVTLLAVIAVGTWRR
jgi:hypothetical protein